MSSIRLFLVAAAVLLSQTAALAGVPGHMTVQGRLVDVAGVPVTPGPVTLVFRIFDAPVGGTELWPGGGESHLVQIVTGGIWSADLGTTFPIPDSLFATDSSMWLEITVDFDALPAEILTRIRLNTQPYAFQSAAADVATLALQADNADLLDGLAADAFAASGHVHDPADLTPQGEGSGLDADFVDGLDASDFAVSLHGHAPGDVSPQGAGSLLDADLLDGQEAASFAASDHGHAPEDLTPQGSGSNLDADLLDGQDASEFADAEHGHGGLWSVNGPDFYYNAGRVGVGTTSPEEMLHVVRGAQTGIIPSGNSIGIFEADNTGYLSLITPDFAERGLVFGEASSAVAGGIYYNSGLTPDGLQFRTAFDNPAMALESSGRLTIGTFTGTGALQVDGIAGNSTVHFPDDAIGSQEILDEPGLTAGVNAGPVDLVSTTMQEIISLNITIPDSGYIVLDGKCNGQTYGTTSRNLGIVQIDEAIGGPALAPYQATFGLTGHLNTVATNSFPVYVQRVYLKGPGEHTFRLVGAKQAGNGAGAVTRVGQSMLTARYYPTSYGTVASVVSAADAAVFNSARPLPEAGSGAFEVDLSELERRAARLKADWEAAERELQRARGASSGVR